MQGIRYTTQDELNRQQWDSCIGHAANGLIYAHSWYLDAMCRQWHALVLNDYEAVMPLTFNKKYGICYLYQPPFTASLGIFGKAVTAPLVKSFLDAIPAKFRYIHGNFFSAEGFGLYERTNYILLLNQPYETVYHQYRDNIKRNIKKCVQQGCTVKKDVDVSAVIELAKMQAGNFSTLSETDFANFGKLYQLLHRQQKAITYGICTAKGELVASCVFFFSHGRAYYILVGNHPNGKTMGASHALIDAFIKDNAGSKLLLDFEGSDIRNLAFFYSSFGAKEEKYPGLRMNRLPAILKWLRQ
jgi:Acetyltransferase (GNAT) domain